MVHVLNFSHPLTERQLAQLAAQLGTMPERIVPVHVQFDLEAGFVEQVISMVDDLGIGTDAWQGEAWVVVPPSLNYITAALLAELHGRMGHFPALVRLRPVPGGLVTEYEVAELINLEQVRQQARTRR
jgi:hypothetical protein